MLEISVGNFFITSNFGTKKLRNEMILLKASMSALFDCKMSNDSLGSWGLLIYIFHHSSCHLSAIMPPHHYLLPPPFPPLRVESQQRERMYHLSMRSRSSLWILICEAKIRLANTSWTNVNISFYDTETNQMAKWNKIELLTNQTYSFIIYIQGVPKVFTNCFCVDRAD